MKSAAKLEGALAHAAAAAGIVANYYDALGKQHDTSSDVAVRCLEAMGFNTAKPEAVAREIRRRRHEAPLAVVTKGKTWRIRAATRRDAGLCSIELEDGKAVAAELSEKGLLSTAHEMPGGYHRLSFGKGRRQIGLAVCPARAFSPAWMERGERRWGLAAQIYSLRGERDTGIGDFSTLAEFISRVAPAGVDMVLINPVGAGFLAQPERKSPYQVSDRRLLNPLMIAAGMPAAAWRDEIDYRQIVPQRLRALRAEFGAIGATEERAFKAWLRKAPPWLAGFAEWEARTLKEKGDTSATRFHEWLQFRAERDLASCAEAARRSGMATGLIRDLAVGPAHDGYETASQPGHFARHVDVGAPPDLLVPKGQNWAIAAFNPVALQQTGFAPFIALLNSNMRHAGGLRIDHVMSLSRLFWIPNGSEAGAYVRYPLEELVSLICLESARAECMVIGEDLGTVPAGLRSRLRHRGILGTKVALFERRKDRSFIPPGRYSTLSLAAVSTHDMPTFRNLWRDTKRSQRVKFAQALKEAVKLRLDNQRELPGFRESFLRLTMLIARSRSALAVFRVEDIALERRAINTPGTGDEHTNWSLRLRCTLNALFDTSPSRVWHSVLKAMQSSR